MVRLELAKWVTREVGEDEADQVVAFTETCSVVDLDTEVALLSAELCPRYKLAATDAIIYATARYATARANGALLTSDRHLSSCPMGD